MALWEGVDLTARILQPWENLRHGPSDANKTLFLDLISPTRLRVLVCSIASRALVPSFTVTGVILLDIGRILSTGLLQLEPAASPETSTLNIQSTSVLKTSGQGRLQVKIGVAAPLVALLLLCLGLSTTILYKHPREVVPRDPRSIAGIALLLRSSNELSYSFRSSLNGSKTSLQNRRFSSWISGGRDLKFSLLSQTTNESTPSTKEAALDSDTDWWRPMALRTWFRITAIIVPLGLIGALEGVQQISDRSDGIATALTPDTAHYGMTIIPAMVFWIVVSLYSTINFNTVLFSPYHALSNGGAISERSLFIHNVGRLPLVQFLSSIKQRHIAAIFTSMAAIIGPFLIIIVSGLYSVVSVSSVLTVEANLVDSFNTSWYGSALDDGGAGQILNGIIWENLSYPDWTYEDLSIPQISLNTTTSQLKASATSLSTTLPARRAILNCTYTDPDEVMVGTTESSFDIYSDVVSSCTIGSGLTLPVNISTYMKSNVTGIGGRLGQLSMHNGSAVAVEAYPANETSTNDPQCQSLIFFYGAFLSGTEEVDGSANLKSDGAQVTTFACQQLIEEVNVTVDLLLPEMTLNPDRPPVIDNTSIRLVDDGKASQYLVTYPLDAYLGSNKSAVARTESASGLDKFYQAVIQNSGLDLSELVGSENIPRLISETNKVYGQYMSQVMSRKMRTELSGKETVPASLTQLEMRVVQNKAPKTALQVLLGFMTLCSIAAWASMRTKCLLPHNPCSIAGVAALLAGGELWKANNESRRGLVIPNGVEWMSDREVRGRGLWKDVVFGLGWWPNGRFGIDAGGQIPGN
ncbi:hypothetical protein BX600DRAFT_259514 [Xylariales sp. PMI_506]|nr:hypothetical protein BX600DRAFT_259514 [Xylariales sp. PMI_506]